MKGRCGFFTFVVKERGGLVEKKSKTEGKGGGVARKGRRFFRQAERLADITSKREWQY